MINYKVILKSVYILSMITYLKGFPYKLKESINNFPDENDQYEDESFFTNTIAQIDDNEQYHPKLYEDRHHENIIVNTIHKFKPTYNVQRLYKKNKMNSHIRDENLKMKTFINDNDGLSEFQKYCETPKTKRGLSVLARWKIFSMLPSENPYYTPHRVFPDKAQRNNPTLYLTDNVISAKTRTFLRPLGAPLRWG